MLPRMDHFWGSQEKWGLVVGQSCSCFRTDVELEVQRTIKRAELTAFWCVLKQELFGPTKVCFMEKRNEEHWSES